MTDRPPPPNRTPLEVEEAVIARADAGDSISAIARDFGLARNTVKAIYGRYNRRRGLTTTDLQLQALRKEVRSFAYFALRYLNRQENTEERTALIERLGKLEAVAASQAQQPWVQRKRG